MSGAAGVAEATPAEQGPGPAAGPVQGPHVRPPGPWSNGVRLTVGAVVLVLLAAGIGSLVGALRDDGGTYPGAEWRGQPQPPRSARIDRFQGLGPLADAGPVPGFGTWSDPGGDWTLRDGWVRFDSQGSGVALVDMGSVDGVVHGRFAHTSPGTGLVFGSPADDVGGLWLVVSDDSTGWDLLDLDGGTSRLVRSFDAPTQQVVVQVARQGDLAKVSFDTETYDVDLPADSGQGTAVGMEGSGPGNRVDLFGYLPLPAG